MDKLRNVDENRPIDYLNLNERFIESREIRLTISLSRILIKISIFKDTENHDAIFSTRREDFEDLENLEIEKKNEKGRGEFLIHLYKQAVDSLSSSRRTVIRNLPRMQRGNNWLNNIASLTETGNFAPL